jgi:hypothetical protein
VIISGRRRGHLDEVVARNRSMAAIELGITGRASIDRAAVQLAPLPTSTCSTGIMLPEEAAGRIDNELLSTPSPPTRWADPQELGADRASEAGVIAYTSARLQRFIPKGTGVRMLEMAPAACART